MCEEVIICGQLITRGFNDRLVHAECVATLQSMVRQLEYETTRFSSQPTYSNIWANEDCDMCNTPSTSLNDGMCNNCYEEFEKMSRKSNYSTRGMITAE